LSKTEIVALDEASIWPFVPAGYCHKETINEIPRAYKRPTGGTIFKLPKDKKRTLNGSRWQVCRSLRNIVMPFESDALATSGIQFRKWVNPIRTKWPGHRKRSKRDCKLIWRTIPERRCRAASGWKSARGLSRTKCKRFDCIWTMKHFCPDIPVHGTCTIGMRARIFPENPRGTALWTSCVALANHREPTKHLTVSRGLTYARIYVHTYISVL